MLQRAQIPYDEKYLIHLYRPFRTQHFFIVTQASLRSTWAIILRPSWPNKKSLSLKLCVL